MLHARIYLDRDLDLTVNASTFTGMNDMHAVTCVCVHAHAYQSMHVHVCVCVCVCVYVCV